MFQRTFSVKTIVLLVLFGAMCAQARFPCADPKYTDWTGPSPDNDVTKCGWLKWIQGNYQLIASLVAPVAIGLLVFLFYPFVMLFRYCCQCCGGSKRRPDGCCCGDSAWDEQPDHVVEAQYSACGVYTTKLLAIAVVVGSAVAIILMSTGFKKFDDNFNTFFDDLHNLVYWAQTQAAGINETMTLPDGSLIPPLNRSFFDDFQAKTEDLDADITKIKHDANVKFYDLINLIQKIVTYAPIGALVLVPLCAICNIRICLPATSTIIYWLCCFIFMFVGGLFFITGNTLEQFCLEVDAQYAEQPGIFQWYVIPKCNDTLPFSAFEEKITDVELDNAQKACEQVMSICDSNQTWSLANASTLFYCGALNDPAADCQTFGDVLNILDTVVVKNGVPTTPAISPVCNSVADSDCSISQCAFDCVDTTLRDNANTTVKLLGFANRTFTAYRKYIRPLMDCNVLINKTLEPFTTCHAFSESLILVGSGAIIYGTFFLMGIIVLLLGQKRFFARNKVQPEELDLAAKELTPKHKK